MRIAVNGVELFFDVYGSVLAPRGGELVDKPVMVALHGGPGIDHSQFVPWLTPMEGITQLILVDHRGNGRSSRPPVETCTLANMADDLEALRKTLGLGRIVVFGMSFGGMLALTYAATYPDSVAALIPCATAASNEAFERGLSRLHAIASPEQRDALARLRTGTVRSVQDLERVFTALAPFYEYDPERSPPGGFRPIADIDMLNWFFARDRHTYDVRSRLGGITVPTLVLTGRHDRIAPPDASEEIMNGIPGAEQVVFEDSGHRLMREENAKFLRTVRDFIRRL
ncbi:alpha/beta fold hydrolase [Reyranella sp.]|uniref:alpha/beta fold hydrolase n=1 Tax=Reyranella sp. TaxID=1929291 RepID=UPI003D1137B5